MKSTKSTPKSKPAPEPLGRHVLRFKWSISRGRDTAGYNVLTLRENGAKVASTCGGGYDMTGTVVADWLSTTYPIRLQALARKRAGSSWSTGKGHTIHTSKFNRVSDVRGQRFDSYEPDPNYNPKALSGLSYNPETKKAQLDGACGIRSVEEVIKALGLEFTADRGNYNKRGGTRNEGIFFVSPPAKA